MTGTRADELAKALLAHFGGIGRLLAASKEAIAIASGDQTVAAAIDAARHLYLTGIREELVGQTVECRDVALHRYLVGKFAGYSEERLHAIYLDRSRIFIREECISGGSTKRLHLQPRRLLQRALDLGAAAFILVHNHPSRNPFASKEDVEATERLANVAAALEIEIIDHLIVGGRRIFSMREGVIL